MWLIHQTFSHNKCKSLQLWDYMWPARGCLWPFLHVSSMPIAFPLRSVESAWKIQTDPADGKVAANFPWPGRASKEPWWNGCGSKKATAMNLRNVRYPPVPCLCGCRGSKKEHKSSWVDGPLVFFFHAKCFFELRRANYWTCCRPPFPPPHPKKKKKTIIRIISPKR